MAYSELIKNFGKIRAAVRDFYVYGFRGRGETDAGSARTYDDEYRRVRSWLKGCVDSYYGPGGKKGFLFIDSRAIQRNPLAAAFRAKSFTDTDITLHFLLLDILADGPASVRACLDRLAADYPEAFASGLPDEGTVRGKLREYDRMGIVSSQRRGRSLVYSLVPDFAWRRWQDAADFFSEAAPLGVVGSYFPRDHASPFAFKHQHLFGILDSEVLLALCACMEEGRAAEITIFSRRRKEELRHGVFPVRLYFSARSGRQYVLCYHYKYRRPMFFRLDGIRRVRALSPDPQAGEAEARWREFDRHLWGVAHTGGAPEHLEMRVHAGPDEFYIPERLMREKRHGAVRQLDETTWLFSADGADASEMLPWIRTFTGRIVGLSCSNEAVIRRFTDDLKAMRALYGGEADAVQ